MKRQLLIVLAALLMQAVCTQARIITPAENQVWWGYFNESDFDTADYTIGTGQAMTLMAAIYVPANHEQLGTSTIQAVRVYLASSAVSSLSGMRLWISKTLPAKISDADFTQTTLGSLVAGANDFKLRIPYEVNNEGFYIGYSVKSTTGYFIRCGGEDAPNSFFVGNPEEGMNWSNLNGQGLGKLAFQILVEGGNFPDNCVTADDFGQGIVLQGQEISLPVTITNNGKNTIETISYTVATDGGSVSEEKSLSVGSLALNGSKTVNIPFASDAEARKYRKTLTITQVDGTPNTAARNSAEGFVITLKEKPAVTPVIEEFTGTWCGWCPRGMVGMEKVHETFGDRVVQIAVHSGDVMAISAYNTVINTYADGYPTSVTDRLISADPSYSSLSNVLKTAFARLTQGSIGLEADWENDAKEKVVFKTTTKFAYDDDSSQYGIAFVLVEDGLTGTGSSWAQQNYYNGQSGDSSMKFWYTAGSSVSGLSFDHVAVAGWSVKDGVTGSVSSKFEANEELEYTFTGSISGNTLIQDKTKLKAIALLVDRTNGVVVNAAQSAISFPTAIDEVQGSASDARNEVFDLDGRRLSTAERGVNLVRMSDGTVRKVLVK